MPRLVKCSIGALSVLVSGICFAAPASAQVETLDIEKRSEAPSRPSARGPITSIRPAALWIAGLDADHDYSISEAEFETGLDDTFVRIGGKTGARLSLIDIEAWRKAALGSPDAAPHVMEFDKDYNGSVSRAEFETTLRALFTRSDVNADKAVTFNELVSVRERPQGRRNADRREERSRSDQRRPQRR